MWTLQDQEFRVYLLEASARPGCTDHDSFGQVHAKTKQKDNVTCAK